MRKYLFPQLPAIYLKVFSWLIVGIIMLVSLRLHPLNTGMYGDETNYYGELDYFNHYGFYQSLAQGTSLGYTLLLYLSCKLLPLYALTVMKIFSAVCYVAACYVILQLLGLFKGIADETRYLGMIFFAYCASSLVWRGLPDITTALVIFIAVRLLLLRISYGRAAIAGFLIFLAFIIKPIAIFYVPALLLYLLLNRGFVFKQKVVQILLLLLVFCSFFVVYHIPGYQVYGRLMLEDKGHTYDGIKRVEATTTWDEINTYYEVYNPNKRENKWHVNIAEVKEFDRLHPGKLNLSYTQFLQQHPDVWAKNSAIKIFLELPYYTDSGMFYHKWTVVNKWVKNLLVIQFISLLLFLFFYYRERNFISKNLYFIVPFTYFILLSLYDIPQLEGNWLISCLPFFALPIMQHLQSKIGVYLILLGQLIIVFL